MGEATVHLKWQNLGIGRGNSSEIGRVAGIGGMKVIASTGQGE